MQSFNVRERVMVLKDMNAKVGNVRIEGITGSFGVPGVDENGESLIDMCSTRERVVGGTFFKKEVYTQGHMAT